jgi:hypothetical protein
VQKLDATTRKQTSPKQTSDAPNRCLKRRAKTVPKPCQNNATRAHPPIRCTPVGTPCTHSSQHAAQARALLLAAAGQARERSFKPITLRPTRAFLTTHPRTIIPHTARAGLSTHAHTARHGVLVCGVHAGSGTPGPRRAAAVNSQCSVSRLGCGRPHTEPPSASDTHVHDRIGTHGWAGLLDRRGREPCRRARTAVESTTAPIAPTHSRSPLTRQCARRPPPRR